ncbi:hypothetical protein, conserved [Eimeria necatrix]|uniref:Uncharacterized protein n=1 Tax=Eimeria necatrix TaxID=51315 RepID=U6MG14_9EIME|nr:hypothetical protein, conserved [Eimeria necatrix]CDJ61998.1 hypothetical protein, conserved [Eimeria necatrix]
MARDTNGPCATADQRAACTAAAAAAAAAHVTAAAAAAAAASAVAATAEMLASALAATVASANTPEAAAAANGEEGTPIAASAAAVVAGAAEILERQQHAETPQLELLLPLLLQQLQWLVPQHQQLLLQQRQQGRAQQQQLQPQKPPPAGHEEPERVQRNPMLQQEAQRCKQEKQQQQQQQQQACYSLYVRGISRSSSDAALKCLFSCFGFVSSFERKHGYCFVVYAEPAAGAIAAARVPCAAAAAAAAIQYLDGASSGCRGEKHLSVHLAKVSHPLPQQLLSCSSSSSSPRSGKSSSSSRCSCNRCNAALRFDAGEVESAAAAAFIVPRSSTDMPASVAASIERQSTEAAATGNEARAATGAAAATTANTPSLLRHISTFLSLIHGQQKKLPFMKIAARGRGFAAAKELTESLGVAIAMQSAVKTLSVSLNDVSALVFIPGDGQHPRTAAAVCLQTPPSWSCVSIDPRMQQQQQQNAGPPAGVAVSGCRFAGVVEDRIFCFQGRAEAFCMHSLDTILQQQQQQQKLKPDVIILLGVHSHAPLQQFFERLLQHYGGTASHFIAVSLPCCGSCGFLKAPLVSRYRDPGILSPQNEVYVHHLPSPAAAATAASSAAGREAAAAATADGRG